jgi:drug/metabolite transporter (DMT)-like permease
MASGAAALILISSLAGSGRGKTWKRGSWASAFFLFAYAACFSFAYLGLTAGTGALILFGSVQVTMLGVSISRGDHPGRMDWLGIAAAVAGLVYLVLPGLSAPPLVSALLMAAAGAAWGLYTLRGRGSSDPLGETGGNFVRALPFSVVLLPVFAGELHLSGRGVMLAVLSGAIASGVGYSVWYAALKHLTSTRAAVLQLIVPPLAAGLGIAFLAEAATARLAIAGALILGGIGLTLAARK